MKLQSTNQCTKILVMMILYADRRCCYYVTKKQNDTVEVNPENYHVCLETSAKVRYEPY